MAPEHDDGRGAPGNPVRSLPPRTPYEDALVGILGDVLGRRDVDVADALLSLGDVASVPRVVAQIRRTTGVDVPVADYVEAQTVAGLASLLAAKSFAARSPARPPALNARPPGARPVLSFDQQRLWMEDQLLPGVVYNVHGRRRIRGALDVVVLEASIRAILARHETLRTRFPPTGGDPVQVVDDVDDCWRIPVTDLGGTGGAGGETVEDAARRLLDRELTTPFDLAAGPPIRCMLVRLDEDDHALGVTMHHIVSDAWSIGLFIRELTALYEAGGDPGRAGLAPLRVQYRDYAAWQRGWLTGDALEHQLGHWRRHLRGAPRALAMPTVQRRTSALRAEAGQVVAELTAGETAALRSLCRDHAVTSFMVLYAVFATVVSRWSGQTDLVIGVPVAGRNSSATDRLIGFFVNLLPLRIDLSDGPEFAELLERVRRVALDGYAHAEAPMDEVVRDLGVVRDPRRTPLFEVVLNVVASPEAEDVTRLVIEPMDTPSLFSRYDVTLTAQEAGGVLRFKLDFPADRCDPPTGRALLGQLRTLLRAAVADPAVRLRDVPAEECAVARVEAPAPPPAVGPAVAAGVDPDLVAIVDGSGPRTHRWLDRAADLVADALAGAGAVAGDPVGVVRRPTAGFVAAVAGAARAGVVATVVETDDPALTGPLGITTVLDAAPGGLPAAGTVDLGPVLPAADAPAAAPPVARPPVAHPPVAHPPVDWAAARFGFGPDDRFVVLSGAPGHLASAMSSASAAGAALLIPERGFGADAGALAAWLRDHAVTVAYVDPPLLRALCAQEAVPGLPALRCVVVDNSGDLLPHDVEAVRARAPGCRVVAVYRVGPDGVPLAHHDAPPDLRVGDAPLRVPLGVPSAGRGLELRSPSGRPAAVGEPAEIWRGDERTGDLGRRWPDGSIEYVGTAGGDASVSPLTVSPLTAWAETVSALRDVPGVRDAVVVEQAGGGGTAPVGYVAVPGAGLDPSVVHNHVKARLPEYLVPRQVVVLDALPRTPWGGYDLRALPRLVVGADGDGPAPPRTPMEQQLTGILEELLDTERVGIHDSFFELGGFSMLATRLIARVREAFGVQLAVRDVFDSPTVDELARLVVHAQVADLDDVEALLAEVEASAR